MNKKFAKSISLLMAFVLVFLNTNLAVLASELDFSEESVSISEQENEAAAEADNENAEGDNIDYTGETETSNNSAEGESEQAETDSEASAENPVGETEQEGPPTIPPEVLEEEPQTDYSFIVTKEGTYNLATGKIEQGISAKAPAILTPEWHSAYKYPKDYFIQGSFYILGDWSRWYLNGQLAYCIQPLNLSSTTGAVYDEINFYALNDIQQKAISKAMLYGDDGTDIEYHIATQVLIWEIALGQVDPATLIHTGIGGTRYSAYYLVQYYGLESKYDSLITEIKGHVKIPSFMVENDYDLDYSPFPYKVPTDGTYLELEDTNGLLADFDLTDGGGYSFTKVGNKLQITASPTATDMYEPAIDSTTLVGQFAPSMLVYGSGAEQVKAIGIKDPAKAFMRLSITKGPAPITGDVEITLRKADPEHFHPQDYSTAQVVFETKDIDTGFNNLAGVGIRVTGTGSGTGDYVLPCTISLGEGTFKITEIMAPNGYVINKNFEATVTVTIPQKQNPTDPEPEPEVNITVKNGTLTGDYTGLYGSSGTEIVLMDNRQKGSLTITKIDFENNYINHNDEHIAQGDATFEGAVFGLYAAEDIILPRLP